MFPAGVLRRRVRLDFTKIGVEAVEALLPDRAIAIQPLGDGILARLDAPEGAAKNTSMQGRNRVLKRARWPLLARAQLLALSSRLRAATARRARNLPTFVVLSRGRTGSTLLLDLLRCHPLVHCDGEILSYRLLVTSPEELLRSRAALFPSRAYGFKLRPAHYQTQRIRDPGAFFAALLKEGWRLVHLTRRNVLRVALSRLALAQTRIVHRKVGDRPVDAAHIHVRSDDLFSLLAEVERETQTERELLASIPHISLTYEEDLLHAECRQPALDRVFSFLELPPVAVSTRYQRLTSDRLSDFVQNYHQLADMLAGTEYSRYLSG